MPQSYPPPSYNELDKVNKKVNDMERMIRELKESNERMMRTMSKQFAQLAISNREKGTSLANPRLTQEGDLHLLLTRMMCGKSMPLYH